MSEVMALMEARMSAGEAKGSVMERAALEHSSCVDKLSPTLYSTFRILFVQSLHSSPPLFVFDGRKIKQMHWT